MLDRAALWRRIGLAGWALGAAALLLAAARDPEVPLLRPRAGASWIVADEPARLGVYENGRAERRFRARFAVERPTEIEIEFSALRVAELRLDGAVIARSAQPRLWGRPRRVLGTVSQGGTLELSVVNVGGPPACWLRAPALGLATGQGWETSRDGVDWSPARPAAARRFAPISESYPSLPALARSAPLFIGVLLLSAWALRRWPRTPGRSALEPRRLRWVLIAAWTALALNNLVRLPLGPGFDAQAHLEYARFLLERWALPSARDGWQMFQPPLYYLLSLPLYKLGALAGGAALGERLLRVIPLLCGVAQIELCYRALCALFPQRPDLQRAGLLIGALLPASIYSSQWAGNEPLAAALTSLALVLALSRDLRQPKTQKRLGAALGLALLAKPTALIALPGLLWLIAARLGRGALKAAGVVLGVAFLVGGWWYLRNLWVLGAPFIGGWDQARGILWWQDPGYRVLSEFLPQPRSLLRPVYAALGGFWDSLYSTLWLDGLLSGVTRERSAPPWNIDLMLSGAWLGLLPSAALLRGLWRALRGEDERRFGAALLALSYLAALAWLYLKVPIYSTAKASYALGLLPLIAALCALGFEPWLRRPAGTRLVSAWLACWCAAAFGAYFALWP